MADLIDRARSAKASLFYVNINHGNWTAGRVARRHGRSRARSTG
jgi:hypothetical protein